MKLPRRRKVRRTPRLKGQAINRIIPHIITVSAMCVGLTAVRFGLDGKWEFAVIAIVIAGILDALDGRMARLLNVTSEFGAILDSLSDFVCFGVAPAMVLFFWSLQELGGFGWGLALFFPVCCALRLARFNSMLGKLPPYAYNYFTGVPAPAGAGLSLLPMVVSFVFGFDLAAYPAVPGIWIVVVALLMVSHLPTYSFKAIKVPNRLVLPLLVMIGLLFAGAAGRPWGALTLCMIAYMASFPFSVRSFNRLKAEAEHMHGLPSQPSEVSSQEDEADDGAEDDKSDDHRRSNLRSV
ncbi:MAG: phosphatidylcholine/phosphatidylserine synthase [Pirellulaceae bacterium]|jgi:CDP-diacylglycerol--serine O-phosphatidyltransferase|nr:phosphatidylcholine/phosphatidylserine synthase [Pirellulaceae bacterium]